MKFTELLKLVESAKSAEEVVGVNDGGRDRRVKRALAELHPDRHEGSDQVQAEHAFKRLQALLGDEKKTAAVVDHAQFDITTKKRAYLVDGLAYEGTIANLYNVRYVRDDDPAGDDGKGKKEKHGLLKVARSPKDGDLINAEAKVLKAVWSAKNEIGDVDGRIPFYARPEETFTYRDGATHIDRRAIVQRSLSGFVSLQEIAKHFPDRFDVRDLAWIWRRVLAGVSLAHDLGYVHGSLTPAHIIVHPEVHGVQIVGWGQSVESGDTIKLLGDTTTKWYKSLYPPEVHEKEPATAATDIFTLSKTMGFLMSRNSPGRSRFEAFIRGCTFERAKTRPQSALGLLVEYDGLLERTFGERKFRTFPDFPGRANTDVIV